MLFETHKKHGYLVLRVEQESNDDTDFAFVEQKVADYIAEGAQKIALSLSVNAYPYSKLMSLLVHCNKMVEARGGQLAVVQPNQDFLDILKRTKLNEVFRVAASEDDLKP